MCILQDNQLLLRNKCRSLEIWCPYVIKKRPQEEQWIRGGEGKNEVTGQSDSRSVRLLEGLQPYSESSTRFTHGSVWRHDRIFPTAWEALSLLSLTLLLLGQWIKQQDYLGSYLGITMIGGWGSAAPESYWCNLEITMIGGSELMRMIDEVSSSLYGTL